MIPIPVELHSGFSDVLGIRLLLDPLFKGLILIAVLGLMIRFSRHHSAQWRSTLWTVLVLGLVLVPLSSLFTPQLTAPLVTFKTNVSVERDFGSPGFGINTQTPEDKKSGASAVLSNASSPKKKVPLGILILALWGIVAALLILLILVRLIIAQRVTRAAIPITGEFFVTILKRLRAEEYFPDVVLVLSDRCNVPYVSGWRNPSLVLPEASVGWTESELVAVLRHELAHVRRHDLLRLVLAEIACALHWYNPIVWVVARSAAISHEMSCDDYAARASGDPRNYARTLLGIAACASNGRTMLAPNMARISGIERRLRYLLGSTAKQPGLFLRIAVFMLVPMLLLPLLAGSAVRTENLQIQQPNEISQKNLPSETSVASGLAKVALPKTGDIHALALAGRTDEVLALLDAHVDLLESRDSDGMTPLAKAAWGNHLDLVDALVARKADLNCSNKNGLSPLFSSLDRGNRRIASRLADAGADLTVTGYRNWTLLHASARIGYVGFVRRLLAAGLDPNATSSLGRTPLHWAKRFDYTDVASELENAGALAIPNPQAWPQKPQKTSGYR